MNAELLRQIAFFRDLPHEELEYLSHSLTVQSLAQGEILFHVGDIGDALYMVLEGWLDIVLGEGTSEEHLIAHRRAGEYVGEMSLIMQGGKRTATARAGAATRLWVMTRHDFDALLRRQPYLSFSIARVLSERLESSNTSTFHEIIAKNRALQQAYDELKIAQEQIIAKEKLEKELQLAAQIQISILPKRLPTLPGFDFGAHMFPARSVGGDFYDVFLLDEHRAGILIGDVADKGVPSAIFMARIHALISAEALHCDNPAEVVRRVNRYMFSRDEIDLFVTVIYGILDSRTGVFQFARAGHEIPLLRAPNQQTQPIPKGRGQPLGVIESSWVDEQALRIPPGGALLLFSDGLTDCRNPQGEEFGRDRLRDTFHHLNTGNAQQICDVMTETLLKFRENAAQDDDVTMVVIRAQ
jgi:serine phosphatase RsbU (regulator of sigma subunit)